MASRPSATRALRQLLTRDGIVVAPGVGDALGARLVEQAGFDAVYMSGFAVGATHGMADFGLLSFTEMEERARQLAQAVAVPVIADADNGYGNALNVIRTTRAFERAGIAAIQLEDQVSPKQCGSIGPARVIPAAEMLGKIKAACDARCDPDFLLIARTDIASTQGMEAAIERAGMYADAGADMVMALGPYDFDEARRFIGSARAPVAYLNSESATMPMIPNQELAALGVKLAIFPLSLLLAQIRAMQGVLAQIKEAGTTQAISATAMLGFGECNSLLGIDELRRQQSQYLE